MPSQETAEKAQSDAVDYDFPPVAELEIEETQYRVDAGHRGAIAVSGRALGTWSWALRAQGQWDGVRLKAKALDRGIVQALERALRAAATEEA